MARNYPCQRASRAATHIFVFELHSHFTTRQVSASRILECVGGRTTLHADQRDCQYTATNWTTSTSKSWKFADCRIGFGVDLYAQYADRRGTYRYKWAIARQARRHAHAGAMAGAWLVATGRKHLAAQQDSAR